MIRAAAAVRSTPKAALPSSRTVDGAYGTLLDGAGAGIASRLDAFEAQQQAAREGV
jgi:hypothetical protein